MSVINTNLSSLKAANSSASANKMLSTSMERLSTGKRINSAKDDAAGLAIATSMTSSIKGMNQGIRNANDGIAMAQTAEGALGEVTNMLQRVRELTVQAKSGTYSTEDRSVMQKEVTQLKAQITSTLDNTEFNGTKLFDGQIGAKPDPDGTGPLTATAATGKLKIQVGANAADSIELDFGTTALKSKPGMASALSIDLTGDLNGKAAVAAVADDPATTGVNEAVTAQDAVPDALDRLDNALSEISSVRADLGAAQARLDSSVNSMTTNVTNLSDARSRIEDTDYSTETAALAKAQILAQASTAMLSQANQSQQNVLSLLR